MSEPTPTESENVWDDVYAVAPGLFSMTVDDRDPLHAIRVQRANGISSSDMALKIRAMLPKGKHLELSR